MHVFIQPLRCGEDVTQGQFIGAVQQVSAARWFIVGISQTARESIPFLLALDQGDYFASAVERHTYHQLRGRF